MCHGSAFGGGIAASTAAFSNLLLLLYLHNVKDDLLTRWRKGILCLTEGISMPLGNCCLPSAQGLSLRLPPNKLFAINLRRYLSAIGNFASLSTCDQMGLFSASQAIPEADPVPGAKIGTDFRAIWP